MPWPPAPARSGTPDAHVGPHDARDALDAIYVEHHAWALRLAVQLTGEPAAAEDLVADIFVKLHRRLQRGPLEQPRAYLRRAVVNHRNSWFRRTFLERRQAAMRVGDDRGQRLDDEQIADRDAVLRALGHLTERMRAVLVLRYYEDLSVQQTAAVLGVAPGTVKTTTHRALARLQALLGEEVRS